MDLAHERLGRAVRLSVYGSLLCTGAALIITVASPECREPENKKGVKDIIQDIKSGVVCILLQT